MDPQYPTDMFNTYRKFVYKCTCYNTRTATDILVNRRCRLFSASKVRAMVDEFMREQKEIDDKKLENEMRIAALVKAQNEIEAAKLSAPTPSTPTPSAPTPSAPTPSAPTPSAPTPSAPTDSSTPPYVSTPRPPPQLADTDIDIYPCEYNRVMILLQIIERLPSYARVGGGMMICALSKYLTSKQWATQLSFIESSQNIAVLWTEQFINACIVINECDDDDAINRFIETEAEKVPLRLSCMYPNEYVDLTFVE